MRLAPRNALSLFALLLLSVPALSPLLSTQLLAGADGQLHLYRLVEFDHLLRSGIPFTRWLPDLAFGYGFPLFNYYAPLAYYLTEPLVLLNVPFSLALNLSLALSLLVGACGVFLWLDELTAQDSSLCSMPSLRPVIYLLGAVAYLYSPYLLFNALARANLAEAWALAFAPWALWAFTGLTRNLTKGNFALAVIAFSAVLLSHNVTGLLFAPLLAGYLIVVLFISTHKDAQFSLSGSRLVILAFLLPFALAAFFWLPALLEQTYVQIARVIVTPDFDYRYNWVASADLVALLPRADTGRLNTQYPATLGILQFLLAALFFLSLIHHRQNRNLHAYLLLAAIVLVGLMLPLSEPVWARVPFLAFVQHPARLRGLIALMLAPPVGYSLLVVPDRMRHYFAVAAIALIPLLAFPMLYPRVDSGVASTPTLATMYAYETQSGALGTTSFGEYLPAWVENPPDRFEPGARLVLPEGARLLGSNAQPTGMTAQISTASDARLVYRSFYFPGWRVLIDGQPTQILPTARDGLVSFNVPAGEHRIEIGYAETTVERIAEFLSLAGVLVFIGLLFFGRRLFSRSVTAIIPGTFPGALSSILFVAILLIGIQVVGLFIETPFVAHFDGSVTTRVTQGLNVNFGGELVLLDADFPSKLGGQPNETYKVKLAWRAVHPLTRNYSVAVHLLDAQGNLVAQSDHLHPGQLPTTRWDVNAYVEDAHTLVLKDTLPSGLYSLVVRAYDGETGKRLMVGTEEGYRLGNDKLRRERFKSAGYRLPSPAGRLSRRNQRGKMGDCPL